MDTSSSTLSLASLSPPGEGRPADACVAEVGGAADPPRVLVVDDSRLTRAVVSELLSRSGYAVESVNSGAAALERVDSAPVDLIVLDHWLPDSTGVEICQQLRAREPDSYVPIIMVTGATDEEQRRAGFAAGVDDYVTKPFSSADLRDRVGVWMQAHLRLKASQQRLRREHTALQEREEQCRRLIAAQSSLLQELQHRVRNNLQLISTLLELVELDGATAQENELVRITRDRIRAMALVHETLQFQDGADTVTMHEYLHQFAAYWAEAHADDGAPPAIHVVADTISLSVERAMLCGLLVNELLTEALRRQSRGRVLTAQLALTTIGSSEAVLGLYTSPGDGQAPSPLEEVFSRELIGALLADLDARPADTGRRAGEIRIIFGLKEVGTWMPHRS